MDINSIIILIMRYLVKINSKYITKFPIDIIGEHYKFNDHEINMLTNKGFIISFYNKMNTLMNQK